MYYARSVGNILLFYSVYISGYLSGISYGLQFDRYDLFCFSSISAKTSHRFAACRCRMKPCFLTILCFAIDFKGPVQDRIPADMLRQIHLQMYFIGFPVASLVDQSGQDVERGLCFVGIYFSLQHISTCLLFHR